MSSQQNRHDQTGSGPGSGTLRLLADDLTGALDSAAPFATPDDPVSVILGKPPVTLPARCGLSTESRHLPVAEAIEAVKRAATLLQQGSTTDTLWFKKVDSVLRGHPFDETAALFRQLDMAACVFAPAFPAEGRTTRDGLHGVLADGIWRPLANGDLQAGLARAGLRLAISPDATTQADLASAIAPWVARGDVLMAGARGLAEALVGARPSVVLPEFGGIVIGTTHPATVAQTARLRAARLAVPVFDLAGDSPDADATLAAVRRLFGHPATPRSLIGRSGPALLVVGGDTLAAALEATGATSVEVMGEVAPGLPFGRIAGGTFAGQEIVTKSGGFGAPDCLVRLAEGQY